MQRYSTILFLVSQKGNRFGKTTFCIEIKKQKTNKKRKKNDSFWRCVGCELRPKRLDRFDKKTFLAIAVLRILEIK